MTTGPGQILDLGFLLPLTLFAAVWLRRRTAWSYFLGGALLVMLAIEPISIGVDQWFGATADPASTVASAAMAPMFGVVALIGLVALVAYVRGMRQPVSPS